MNNKMKKGLIPILTVCVLLLSSVIVSACDTAAPNPTTAGLDTLGITNETESIPATTELLQPVGISEVFEAEGVRLEIAYVVAYGNFVDIYFTVEDLVGGRFDEENFELFHQLMRDSERDRLGIADGSRGIVGKSGDNVFTLHSRTYFVAPIERQTMALNTNFLVYLSLLAEYAIDVDLAVLTPVESHAHIGDMPILPPHTHDIALELPGYDGTFQARSISSIGILEGRLHIQDMRAAIPETAQWTATSISAIRLINPHGEYVDPAKTVNFSINADGNIHVEEDPFATTFRRDEYFENVYEVDLDMLSEYRLVVYFLAANFIDLNWAVELEIEVM